MKSCSLLIQDLKKEYNNQAINVERKMSFVNRS